MSGKKGRPKIGEQSWVVKYEKKLQLFLEKMDTDFFTRLYASLVRVSQTVLDVKKERVRILFESHALTSVSRAEDLRYLRKEFPQNAVFANSQDKLTRKWLQFAVACLILSNVNGIEPELVNFFWQPILAALHPHQRDWPGLHLDLKLARREE